MTCSITSNSVLAGSNYFWLVRIMPNLRTLVQGLARVSIPEGATNAAAEMNYYRLGSNSLPSSIGTGPNPQTQVSWNINNLMSLNWQALPQRRITSSGEVSESSTFSSIESVQNYFPDTWNELFRLSPMRGLFGTSSSSFGLPIPFFHIPLNVKITASPTGQALHNGVEIAPQGTNTQLIAPMTPVQSSITGQLQNSQLASIINTALSNQESSESSFNPLITNLFSMLANESPYSDNMFFIQSLNSYLLLSPSTNSVLSLVPHETLVRLGLIPDADAETDSHRDPDTWGEKK